MRKISTKIENGVVFLNMEVQVNWSDVENIISYMIEMEATVNFENGDTEEHYTNLIDTTGNFIYDDCEALFTLGLVDSSSFNGETEFGLSFDYKERLMQLKRLNAINTVIDD